MSNANTPDMTSPEFPRQYVAADADMGVWKTVEQYYRELLERPVEAKEQLEKWLLETSELEACIGEERARRYVASTLETDNEECDSHCIFLAQYLSPLFGIKIDSFTGYFSQYKYVMLCFYFDNIRNRMQIIEFRVSFK